MNDDYCIEVLVYRKSLIFLGIKENEQKKIYCWLSLISLAWFKDQLFSDRIKEQREKR
jgi:hypothetical protein